MADTTIYTIDTAHSRAHFSVKHMTISTVRGEFTSVTGTLTLDPSNPSTGKVEASIDINSIHTGQPDRDAHLKSPEFFDAATYPTITFVSKSITPVSSDEATLVGDLTIHGITKEVSLTVEGGSNEVKDPYGNLRLGFSATTKIKRSDFGLVWSPVLEAGGLVIGDDIKIELDVQFLKSA